MKLLQLKILIKPYDKLTVYPSDSNFIFIKFSKTNSLYKYLQNHNINIKVFGKPKLKNYFRVTIGTKKENDLFLSCIKKFFNKNK